MVTGRTDDKSRTSESNLAGVRNQVRENWEFLAIRMRANGELHGIMYASISNLRETMCKITGIYTEKRTVSRNNKPNKIQARSPAMNFHTYAVRTYVPVCEFFHPEIHRATGLSAFYFFSFAATVLITSTMNDWLNWERRFITFYLPT